MTVLLVRVFFYLKCFFNLNYAEGKWISDNSYLFQPLAVKLIPQILPRIM